MQIRREDPSYPSALRDHSNAPHTLTTSGPLVHGRAVAIVGSRSALDESLMYAYELAFDLASAGVIVISGGAVGVDGAAHRGALDAGGATWVVSPTGQNRVYPPEHTGLFEEVARSTHGRMIWPFEDDTVQSAKSLRYRNGVIVALSQALVVIQARFKSGSRNAASWAKDLDRPLWAVPASPWCEPFSGSNAELESDRAKPLWSAAQLFKSLALPLPPRRSPTRRARTLERLAILRGASTSSAPPPSSSVNLLDANPRRTALAPRTLLETPLPVVDQSGWTDDEKLIFSNVLPIPTHIDAIIQASGVRVQSAVTALLTLSLKDVVVEGPDGFFRRRSVA